MKKFRKVTLKLLGVLTCLGMLTICLAMDKEESVEKTMVSLGDSYSSGEGNSPYYSKLDNSGDILKSPDNEDWLAHRSQNAWPGKLRLKDMGPMKNYKDDMWFFKAVSGARTVDIDHDQEKTYTDEFLKEKKAKLPAQTEIFKQLKERGQRVDYVTLTIGGNDVDFAKIIETAAKTSYDNPNILKGELERIWAQFDKEDGIKKDIYDSYNSILKKAGKEVHVIVVGYPKLFDVDGTFDLEPDGELGLVKYAFEKKGITKEEAELINDNVSKFNESLSKIVAECRKEGKNISFVDVEKEFEGHGAYAADPFLYGISLFARHGELKETEMTSAQSIHPNAKGCDAYARCVQREIDRLEASEENIQKQGIYLNNEFSIDVLDSQGKPYHHYSLEINGKFYKKFWFFKFRTKNYYKKIEGDSKGPIKLKLDHGSYSFKFTDKKTKEVLLLENINVFDLHKQKNLKVQTKFGEKKKDTSGKTEIKKIEGKKKDFKAGNRVPPEELLEKIYGTWRDIDLSFKEPDPHGDIRATISKDRIAFYYNKSDVGVFGKYKVVDYDQGNQSIQIQARIKQVLDSYDLRENNYFKDPNYKNVKIYNLPEYFSEKELLEEDLGKPLTGEEIQNRIAQDEESCFVMAYDNFSTIKLIDHENMTITDDFGVRHYKYLLGPGEYDNPLYGF